MDVVILQGEHLCGLETAHLAVRREHEDADAALAPHGVFRRGAGVARCGAENVEFGSCLGQRVFEQVAKQLHGHILEGQCRAVGEFKDMQPGFQRAKRRDLRGIARRLPGACIAIHGRRVSALDQSPQIRSGDVGDEPAQDLIREVGIGECAPLREFFLCDFRVSLGQVQATIGCQAGEQDFRKVFGRRLAPGADVAHDHLSSNVRECLCLFVQLFQPQADDLTFDHRESLDPCDSRIDMPFACLVRQHDDVGL